MRTLVIEDDAKLQKLLRRALIEEGFSVDVAADGERGLFLAETESYDAIILDLMIPKIPGIEVLGLLRKHGRDTPVLILTARDGSKEKVAGFDRGADDYMTKPFTLAELVARLRALIRRTHRVVTSTIRISDLEIDTSGRRVTRGGKAIDLPAKQYALLELLALNKGKIITRTQIYEKIYDYESDTLSNIVDVHMCRLRDLIDRNHNSQLIHTVRGQGYVIKEPK